MCGSFDMARNAPGRLRWWENALAVALLPVFLVVGAVLWICEKTK